MAIDATDVTCFALPIQPGKTAAARAFLQELEGQRKEHYAASDRRLGLTKEVWAIQQTPGGDLFVVYFEGADIGRAFRQFAASRDEFDVWFKRQVQETTGADLNTPPAAPLSEVLSRYAASCSTAARCCCNRTPRRTRGTAMAASWHSCSMARGRASGCRSRAR